MQRTTMGPLAIILSFLVVSPVVAQMPPIERSLGIDEGWQTVSEFRNTQLEPGWRGGNEVVLQESQFSLREETDLLVNFTGNLHDAAGNYHPLRGHDAIVSTPRRTGGAAGFDGSRTVSLLPGDTSLFSPGAQVQSFSIDLWFYPHHITEGGELLRWRGALLQGGRPVLQEIRFEIHDRRMRWVMDNVIAQASDNGSPEMGSVTLSARRILIPRTWQHHQLRFDATTGRLSYVVDGQTEAVTHLTRSGREDGSVNTFLFGADTGDGLVLGLGIEGALDMIRITRSTAETHHWTRLSGDPGMVLTRPIDLSSSSVRVEEIRTITAEPGNTHIRGYYRLGDTIVSSRAEDALDSEWQRIPESGVLSRGGASPQGRYIQLRYELLADAGRSETPRLRDVVVRYIPGLPPVAPRQIVGEPITRGVRLQWNPVPGESIAGYRIFFGESPGRYMGTHGVRSPLDAGDTTEIEIHGLPQDVPFVFAIESYTEDGQASPLSHEVEVRAGR